MDTKALARSKRAHTQHHSRRPLHPNQTPKASSEGASGSGSAKKPLGKQARGGSTSRPPRALPSNWDRYDDEFDSDSEQHLAGNNASQTSDDILPKSKGADYRYLITEALSQSQSSTYSDGFASLDDVLPDFNQGVSSMLAVRGEGILSWIGGDNFIVEDRATTSQEASFLSLNLHALAEQLEQVELSKRLFIEADLLPPELLMEGSKPISSQKSDKIQVQCQNKLPEEEPVFQDFTEKLKITNQSNTVMSLDSGSDIPDLTSPSRAPSSANHTDIDLKQLGKSSQSEPRESTAKSEANSIVDRKVSESKFKAAAAEAELDMLLDSFSETKPLESSGPRSMKSSVILGLEASTALLQVPDNSSTASITANIDDVLDDLLEETSNLVNPNALSQTQNVNPPNNVQSFPSSGAGTKSKVLDDFDSWLDTI